MHELGGAASNIDAVIQTGVSLQPYNSLAIPAKAAFFTRCTSVSQLLSSFDFAKNKALALVVLGEGSNTVFSGDFEGLVVLNRLTGIKVIRDDHESVIVNAAAGENWHDFVRYSLENSWFGLENLALIPGLIGAAPIQNIGAYGVEVKSSIEAVHALDIESGKVRTFTNADCRFGYRDSVFKQTLSGKYVITSVDFRLAKKAKLNLTYPALAKSLGTSPTSMDVFNAVCQIRSSKLPMPDDIPNAGSFFKNPIVNRDKYDELKALHPSIVAFELDDDRVKLAAAWLIEQRQWKEKSVDAVYVHRDQALVIVNPNLKHGGAVLKLASAIQEDVRSAYGISLEIEPRIY